MDWLETFLEGGRSGGEVWGEGEARDGPVEMVRFEGEGLGCEDELCLKGGHCSSSLYQTGNVSGLVCKEV